MPFNILSPLTLSAAPTDVAQTSISNLTVPDVNGPTTDIDGGRAEIIGANEGGSFIVRYVDADGTATDTEFSQAGFGTITDTNAVVFDASAKTFAVPNLYLGSSETIFDYPTVPGVVGFQIQDDGSAVEAGSFFIPADEYVDDFTGDDAYDPNFIGTVTLESLGEGRISLTSSEGQIAIADSSDVVLPLGNPEVDEIWGNFNGSFFDAADGGYIIINQPDPVDSPLEFVVHQFDGDQVRVEAGGLDFAEDLAALGLEAATTTVHAELDENGDLVFSFTEDDVTYATTLDLLPETPDVMDPVDEDQDDDPVIEGPDSDGPTDALEFVLGVEQGGTVATNIANVFAAAGPDTDASGGTAEVIAATETGSITIA